MIPAQFADEFDFELPGSNERHRQKGTRDSIEDCMETTKTACMVQMIKPWRHTEGLKNWSAVSRTEWRTFRSCDRCRHWADDLNLNCRDPWEILAQRSDTNHYITVDDLHSDWRAFELQECPMNNNPWWHQHARSYKWSGYCDRFRSHETDEFWMMKHRDDATRIHERSWSTTTKGAPLQECPQDPIWRITTKKGTHAIDSSAPHWLERANCLCLCHLKL